ncbi:hypothetical protein [[Eubacterium] cellulosolvens]
MKMKPKKLAIIGLILLIIGIMGAILSFYVIIENPSDVAEKTLYFEDNTHSSSEDTSGLSQVTTLEKGTYEIWYEPEIFGLGGPEELTVHDSEGDLVFSRTSLFGSGDSISRNGKDYRKYGSFDIDDKGEYTISVGNPTTIYLTPPINLGLGLGLGYLCVVIGIIGIITMIIAGILMFMKEKKPSTLTDTPPPPQYPYYPSYPGYPYQPPPQQQPPPTTPSQPSPPPQAQAGGVPKKLKLRSKRKTKKQKVAAKIPAKKTETPVPSSQPVPPATSAPPTPTQASDQYPPAPYPPSQYPPQQSPYPYYNYPYYPYDSYYYYYYNSYYSNPYYYPYHDDF